jgi:hypothetical protein
MAPYFGRGVAGSWVALHVAGVLKRMFVDQDPARLIASWSRPSRRPDPVVGKTPRERMAASEYIATQNRSKQG